MHWQTFLLSHNTEHRSTLNYLILKVFMCFIFFHSQLGIYRLAPKDISLCVCRGAPKVFCVFKKGFKYRRFTAVAQEYQGRLLHKSGNVIRVIKQEPPTTDVKVSLADITAKRLPGESGWPLASLLPAASTLQNKTSPIYTRYVHLKTFLSRRADPRPLWSAHGSLKEWAGKKVKRVPNSSF